MMDERNWVRVVGHKNVPGKPALYATTKQFLDYFGLKSLDELPSLPEIMRLGEGKNLELDLIVAVDAEQALSSQVSADLVTISSADNQEMLDTSKLEHDRSSE